MNCNFRVMNSAWVMALIVSMLPCASRAAPVPGQGTWESTLLPRDLDGNSSTAEAYYDSSRNLTWLADADFARTSGASASGQMNWQTANAWAASLNLGGITGWRLPATIDAGNDGVSATNFFQGLDWGYNVTVHSEMSYLYYVTLGNIAAFTTSGDPQSGAGIGNSGPFSHLLEEPYWSGTQYAAPGTEAWLFDFSDGLQDKDVMGGELRVWAVHSGDVGTALGAAPVPVPPTLALLSSALGVLSGVARCRRQARRRST